MTARGAREGGSRPPARPARRGRELGRAANSEHEREHEHATVHVPIEHVRRRVQVPFAALHVVRFSFYGGVSCERTQDRRASVGQPNTDHP